MFQRQLIFDFGFHPFCDLYACVCVMCVFIDISFGTGTQRIFMNRFRDFVEIVLKV